MKKCFVFWIIVMVSQQFCVHAMLIRRSRLIPSWQPSRIIRPYAMIKPIVDYNTARDEKNIAAIAFKCMPKLMSDVTTKNRQDLLEKQVIPAINNKETATKVYLINDEAVGFINYFTWKPWYTDLIPQQFQDRVRTNATIQMLAVDDKHQGKKIGSTLLEHALEDCKKQSIYKVNVGITDRGLADFYGKFDFELTSVPAFRVHGPCELTKRLS
jgi:GNAT superfamily N-acetyltransferase